MKQLGVWKIKNVKLNKKNFWTPFLISSIFSFFLYPLTLLSSFYLVQIPIFILDKVEISFFYFISQSANIFFNFSLITPIIIFLALIPGFFIIRKLLKKNPQKIFSFELPILIIIYYLINSIIGGLMMLGGGGILTILAFIAPVTLWLTSLVTILYFYYKRFVFP